MDARRCVCTIVAFVYHGWPPPTVTSSFFCRNVLNFLLPLREKQEITYWPAHRLFLLFFPPKKFLIVFVFKFKKKAERKKKEKTFNFFKPVRCTVSFLCSYTMIYICLFSWSGEENIRKEGAFDLIWFDVYASSTSSSEEKKKVVHSSWFI